MKIALIGYGKMGKTIERLAKSQGHQVVYTKDRNHENGKLTQADVAIEFSVPEAAYPNIKHCLEKGIPVVSGTTGWLDQYDKIVAICQNCNGSFLYASNFSIGVNLFFEINRYAAKLMSNWDMYYPAIEEIHHIQKKDAPSGTAISLAEPVYRAFSLDGWTLKDDEKNKLPIEARREGDVKGIHIVKYTSDIDSIALTHQARSREGFAKGAILAASWIRDRKGVYDMKDVLGLHSKDED